MNKKLLIFFFIYIVLEGALRKWFLPEYNNLLFLFKDIIIIIAFLSLVLNKKSAKKGFSFLSEDSKTIWFIFVALIFFYGLLINFDNLTIIGWRYYLVSVPLVILIPFYFNKDLNKHAYYYLLLSFPVLLLGVYQYFNPQDTILNKYAWLSAAEKIATFGDNRPRITGTFSYISPYTIYLQTLFLLGWVLLLSSKNKTKILLITANIFLIFINLIMTGSRGPVLISVILSLPFIYYYLTKSGKRLGIAIIIGGLIFGAFNLLVDPLNAFTQRAERAGDSEMRIYGALLSPIVTISTTDIIGIGLGKTFLGLSEISQNNSDTVFDEINQDRVGVELGIIGYLFVLFIKIYFLLKTFSLFKKVNASEIKLWLWFSLSIQLSGVWSIPFYNSIAITFYFTSIGIYYLMRRKQIDLSKEKVLVKN